MVVKESNSEYEEFFLMNVLVNSSEIQGHFLFYINFF